MSLLASEFAVNADGTDKIVDAEDGSCAPNVKGFAVAFRDPLAGLLVDVAPLVEGEENENNGLEAGGADIDEPKPENPEKEEALGLAEDGWPCGPPASFFLGSPRILSMD